MKIIRSTDNVFYKQLKKLNTSLRERRKAGKTLLDGVHLIQSALQSGLQPETLVVSEAAVGNAEITELIAKIAVQDVICLPDHLFSAISPVETPTGILAVITIPVQPAITDADFCLMVENVQDPGNLGSILRSAAASGVKKAFLSAGCADVWSPKVLRSGMGAHFVLAVEEQVNVVEKTDQFDGVSLATSLDADHSVFEVDLTGRVAVLVGNEGAGLSPQLCAAASIQVKIPMASGMESLNVAAATAICLFERVRQRLVA